jgi:hypothetical protein
MPTLLVGTPEHSRKISGACSRLFSAAGKHAIIPNTRSTDLFIVTFSPMAQSLPHEVSMAEPSAPGSNAHRPVQQTRGFVQPGFK